MPEDEKKFDRRPNRTFPRHSLEEASVIAIAIQNNNAGKPMNRLLLADSIGRKPTSPEFRDLLSSSFRYGLTLGTEKADAISLTDNGQHLTKPQSVQEEMQFKQGAILFPDTFKKIFEFYKNSKFPSGQFFENTLEKQFSIPREYVKELASLLEKNGKFAGIIRDVSGSPCVIFDNLNPTTNSTENSDDTPEESAATEVQTENAPKDEIATPTDKKVKKVFVSHGKNEKVLGQIITTLQFGGFEPVVAKFQETTAIPVPEKIMTALHECDAGIINISADETYKDGEGQEQYKINENVLIEIGAAFVLYKKKVILVADKRVKLPSNLQGLYICNYEGDSLDWESGLKLQKALTEFLK